jgi:hypothetical protein
VSDHVSRHTKQPVKSQFCMSYSSYFWIANWKTKILHRMIASIFWPQSSLNFFLTRILIHYGCSQIYEIFHPFKELLSIFTL